MCKSQHLLRIRLVTSAKPMCSFDKVLNQQVDRVEWASIQIYAARDTINHTCTTSSNHMPSKIVFVKSSCNVFQTVSRSRFARLCPENLLSAKLSMYFSPMSPIAILLCYTTSSQDAYPYIPRLFIIQLALPSSGAHKSEPS